MSDADPSPAGRHPVPGPANRAPDEHQRERSDTASGLCELLGLDRSRVADLVATLAAAGETIAAAESLTAGLFTAALTEIPGSSAVLRGGIVCYATDLKHSLVGVDPDLLARVGPVDADVAVQLAGGARARCGARIGVGLTGVAGPEAQDGVAPGTVFVAAATDQLSRVRALPGQHAPTDRWQVRARAVRTALELVRELSAAPRDAPSPGSGTSAGPRSFRP